LPLPDPGITVRVGRASDAAARQLQARAFTHDGEVHVSSAALGGTQHEVEGLIAHEMHHVLQQRIIGPGRLPLETTAAGAALEAEAQAVERAVRTSGEFRLPLTSPVAMDLARYGTLTPWTPPAQAAPRDPAALLPLAPPVVIQTPVTVDHADHAATASQPGPAMAAQPVPVPERQPVQEYHWEAPWAQVQRAGDDATSGTTATASATATPAAGTSTGGTIESHEDAGELADQLYPFIEARLRRELRRHRDRAGRVTDMDL
jgi:hypothetical protein